MRKYNHKPSTIQVLGLCYTTYIIQIINSKYPEIKLDSLTSDNAPKELQTEFMTLICSKIVEIYAKSPVWFLINQSGALYSIGMYYDNEYNRADGSDL